MKNKIKVVFFDLDGTLVDSERYYVEGTYNWLKELGFKGQEKDLIPIVGKDMNATYAFLKTKMPNLSITEIKEYNDHYFHIKHPIVYPDLLFKDVLPCLKELKKNGYICGICSMDSLSEIKYFMQVCEVEKYFSDIFSGIECKHNKPDPEIYLKALAAFNLTSDEAVVVEDSYSGILASKRAGLLTFARRDNRFAIDQSKADYCIDDLSELITYLKEFNK